MHLYKLNIPKIPRIRENVTSNTLNVLYLKETNSETL